VLKLCRAAGLVRLGHVALDGTKMQANASLHKAMSYGRMREAEKKLSAEVSAWLARAEAADTAEDREHGADKRGDEMPDWVANKMAQLGGTLAFANQLVESIAFLRVEPDHVFLDGNLFPGHESPPSLPCRDRDSEIPVMINDGGD
jgi:hypothetical protein